MPRSRGAVLAIRRSVRRLASHPWMIGGGGAAAAVVAVRPEQWVSIGHLGALAAEAKRRAKQQGAGTILVNAV